MASSEAIAIERIGRADIGAALALSAAAGWNQNAADWAFFVDAGETVGLRDDEGTLVATAAALPYDARVGWISMVLVDAAHRHRGIASRLVERCVASLRAGGRTPVLDATPAGAAVYAGSGFVEGFAFERWERAAAPAPPYRGSAATAIDAAPQVALDRDAAGVERASLWRTVLARPGTRVWQAPAGDGFVLRRAGRRATQVGPIVAADADAALDLLAAALGSIEGAVFIDVPVRCTPVVDELARRGFVRQRSFVRMALGDARAAAARDRVFALAGPEFG